MSEDLMMEGPIVAASYRDRKIIFYGTFRVNLKPLQASPSKNRCPTCGREY